MDIQVPWTMTSLIQRLSRGSFNYIHGRLRNNRTNNTMSDTSTLCTLNKHTHIYIHTVGQELESTLTQIRQLVEETDGQVVFCLSKVRRFLFCFCLHFSQIGPTSWLSGMTARPLQVAPLMLRTPITLSSVHL